MSEMILIKNLKSFYHENQKIVNLITKAIAMFVVFISVLKSDYGDSLFYFFDSFFVIFLIALLLTFISVFLDIRVFMLLFCVFVPISISSNLVYSLVALAIFMLVFILYGSVLEQYASVIMFTVCCCYLRIPYFAPIFLALNRKSNSVVPMSVGFFVYYIAIAVNNMFLYGSTNSDMLEQLLYGGIYLLNFAMTNGYFVMLLVVFIITYLISYFIKYSGIDYNIEISIVTSTIIFIIFVVFNVFLQEVGNNIFLGILSVLISMIIAYFLSILECSYDYDKVRKVYFQDDENVYYIKIVPKMK